MSLKQIIGGIWRQIPDGRPKHRARMMLRRILPDRLFSTSAADFAMTHEISRLDIAEAVPGEAGNPRIRLTSGLIFNGLYREGFDRLYDTWPRWLRDRIPRGCASLAADIVCRYQYPHADIAAVPPYPVAARKRFHPQHRDTVHDIPGLSAKQRQRLCQQFALRPGDVVVDVGAFIGMGAMWIGSRVGASGRVLSVEAHPLNQAVFESNMRDNNVTNVSLFKGGVWNEPGEFELQCETHQANSLVSGLVNVKGTVKVPTESVDNLVTRFDLPRVNLVSLTINGAEVEALRGMRETLTDHGPNLTIAGWYMRDDKPIHEYVTPILRDAGYQTIVGPVGRVYAWKGDAIR